MPLTLWPWRQIGTPAALGDRGGPAESQQAAGLVRGEADGVAGALADEVVDVVLREHRLVGGDGHVHGLTHLAQRGHAEQGRRLLDPVDAEGLERVDHADGVRHAPGAVGIHAQAAVADDFPHGRRVPQVGLVAAADLEVDDAVTRRGKLAGVLHQLVRRVALYEPEVVDLVAHGAAEEPVDRLAGGLADRVPERHVDAGEHEIRVPWQVIEAAEVPRLVRQPRHIVDRLAHEQRLDAAERRDGALGGERRHRFADAGDAGVGLDLDEDDRRAVVDATGPVIRLLEGQEERGEPDAGDEDPAAAERCAFGSPLATSATRGIHSSVSRTWASSTWSRVKPFA